MFKSPYIYALFAETKYFSSSFPFRHISDPIGPAAQKKKKRAKQDNNQGGKKESHTTFSYPQFFFPSIPTLFSLFSFPIPPSLVSSKGNNLENKKNTQARTWLEMALYPFSILLFENALILTKFDHKSKSM